METVSDAAAITFEVSERFSFIRYVSDTTISSFAVCGERLSRV